MRPPYALLRTILCLMMLHAYGAQKIYSMSIKSFSVTCRLSNLTNHFIDHVEGLLYVQPSDYSNANISWIGYINCNNSKDIIRDIFSAQSNKAMAVVLFSIYDKPCDVHLPINISMPIFFEADAECKNYIFNTKRDESPNVSIYVDEDNEIENKIIIIIFITIAVVFIQIIVCFIKVRFFSSILVNNESSNVRNNRNDRSKENGITSTVLNSFPVYLFPQIKDETSNDLEKGKCKELLEESDQSHNVGRALAGNNSIMIDDEIIEIYKQLTCSICLSDFVSEEELRILPCNHQYHRVCIDPWLLNISSLCPVCKADCKSWNAELPVTTRDGPSSENPNNISPQIIVNFQTTEGRCLGDGNESVS
ncbi:5343_t:CDS:2 [Acaulospora morrowiae]|uniref:5343_t:CDS:1 n=1 Tax=Acaulospora morrowiae TaxID=94023 RepID=A0A9N9B8A2_9GLOM|nr:5343_t:CDS:2 [Acaulospora morrowiae]